MGQDYYKWVYEAIVYIEANLAEEINLPEVAESILTEGRADLIGIARQLVADPYWPEKVKEGRGEEIMACKSCNACFKPMQRGLWNPDDPICAVNKRAGREFNL